MFMEITGIDLFDLNVGMACANVRRRCLWILIVFIYFIKMWVWHGSMLDSFLHGYHWH